MAKYHKNFNLTHQFWKNKKMNHINFSVVTIVYNDILHIIETMDSVVGQSYKQIEYILIDGESTDGTKEKIIKYISSHANITVEDTGPQRYYLEATHRGHPTFTFKFLSEKDHGIYDAMNKGIALATKEWINFMNCGDRFYNSNVLEKITQNDIKQYDVIYGNTEIAYIDQNINIIKSAPQDIEKSLIKFGSNLIHQSIFFKTCIHKNNLYNTQDYRLASDYELIYRLFSQNFTFHHIPITISIFHTGGSSDIYAHKRTKESLSITIFYQKAYLLPILIFCFAEIKKVIKIYFPKTITKEILKLISK